MKRIKSRRWVGRNGDIYVEEIDTVSGQVTCKLFPKDKTQPTKFWAQV